MALASAEERDALVLLQAILTREKQGKKVQDPTRFVVGSMNKRMGTAAKSPAQADTPPVAKVASGKIMPAKAPVTKAPIAKAPISKAPIVKAADGNARGAGKAPVIR